ncbi:methyltransferase-like protein 22 isoform X1 [Penaeus monodon]|uniref:methyltransferase-like protein 22 isoform X1 n=1 Tax=Penaeus monodon TaxID=6687 RepID=UPI0018A722D1|nr:methyltransferase-like protein 22 isoform X1 [Penaeus monodon]
MASEDAEELTVTSEVHHFSKEDVIDGSEGDMSTISQVSQQIDKSQEVEDEDLFECILGANGQVVLWSAKRETVLSRFDFVYPPYMTSCEDSKIMKAVVDADGDLQVTRKNTLHKKEGVVLIEQYLFLSKEREHQSATTLDLVGEQVWRGALFLADFILHHPEIFKNANILELASGVGLTSIVAGMLAKKVVITDVDRGDILTLIDRNVERNRELMKAEIFVKEIDFYDHATIDETYESLKDISVIMAADTIYHNQLTDQFFRTILRLMSEPPNKTMYVALEKRFVFTIEDMDTVAPCYDYFLDRIDWLRCQNLSTIDWTIEEVPIEFKQYFIYEKTRHLVLWKIAAELK